jgi:hypothetical protein
MQRGKVSWLHNPNLNQNLNPYASTSDGLSRVPRPKPPILEPKVGAFDIPAIQIIESTSLFTLHAHTQSNARREPSSRGSGIGKDSKFKSTDTL